MSDDPNCEAAPAISSVSRSALMLRRIERSVVIGENRYGRQRLLEIVNSVDAKIIDDHVDQYRHIVRNHTWPHDERQAPLATFLDEYEGAAHRYVNIGITALVSMAENRPCDLESLYSSVAASECLRGQFGKRSPTGLDARLDQADDELFRHLGGLAGDPKAMDAHVLLGTPGLPHLTAEAQLGDDLLRARAAFPEPPTVGELFNAEPERLEAYWVFLRRHCAWSQRRASRLYETFSPERLEAAVRIAERERRRMAIRRAAYLRRFAKERPAEWLGRMTDLATAVNLLNHVNLSLEPCFSFKGGVGLGHNMVFRAAAAAGMEHPSKEVLTLRKWRLFEEPLAPIQAGAWA